MPSPSSTPDRARRALGVAAAALVLLITAFLAFAASAMTAEPQPLAIASNDPQFTLTETVDAVVLTPDHPTATGLVFLAGARVEPAAYASKLSGLAVAGVTVVIARPLLNLAILDTRPLDTFERLAPEVTHWFVGGHSLGGVRACSYAALDDVAGMILFASSCADDISASSLPVLSLAGERDGLSTPAKVAAASDLLPPDAEFVELPGTTHAQFGDYGPQPGDGIATATDADVRDRFTAAITAFLDRLDGH